MTRSAAVEWRPDQTLHLMQRFKCNDNNVIYMLHCAACLDLHENDAGDRFQVWTNYIGQTSPNVHFITKVHIYKSKNA